MCELAPACERIKVIGSIRRGADYVGNVESVAIPQLEERKAARQARAYVQAVESAPCDLLVWRAVPFVERTQTQRGMARSCETVFRQILPELEARGVEVWQE